jgi:hypothetical protein
MIIYWLSSWLTLQCGVKVCDEIQFNSQLTWIEFNIGVSMLSKIPKLKIIMNTSNKDKIKFSIKLF